MKTPKLPKFMVCENPMVEQSSTTQFILHSQDPAFVAVVLDEYANDQYQTWHHPNSEIVLYINELGLMEFYKLVPMLGFGDDFNEKSVEGVMKRMADWWLSYLSWDSKERQVEGEPFRLKDFSPKVKNLKVITDKKEEKYIIIHEGFVRYYDSEIDSKIYLYKLGFTDDDFATGYINIPIFKRIGEN